MLRCLNISYAKIVRNIWKLSGHADFLNFFYFYHSTFGTFDPRLEAVWKSKLLISLMPYFVFRSITKIVLILSIFENISRLCQNITLYCSDTIVAVDITLHIAMSILTDTNNVENPMKRIHSIMEVLRLHGSLTARFSK